MAGADRRSLESAAQGGRGPLRPGGFRRDRHGRASRRACRSSARRGAVWGAGAHPVPGWAGGRRDGRCLLAGGAPRQSQRAGGVRARPRTWRSVSIPRGRPDGPRARCCRTGNLIANLESFRTVLHVTEEDVFLAVLPFFHAYGATVLFLEPLSLGAHDRGGAALRSRGGAAGHGAASRDALRGRPEHVRDAGRDPAAGRRLLQLAALHLGGRPAARWRWRRPSRRQYGIPIYEGYGPTECAPVLTVNPPFGTRKLGSVGPPIPQVELRVVDDRGNALVAGARSARSWPAGPT